MLSTDSTTYITRIRPHIPQKSQTSQTPLTSMKTQMSLTSTKTRCLHEGLGDHVGKHGGEDPADGQLLLRATWLFSDWAHF